MSTLYNTFLLGLIISGFILANSFINKNNIEQGSNSSFMTTQFESLSDLDAEYISISLQEGKALQAFILIAQNYGIKGISCWQKNEQASARGLTINLDDRSYLTTWIGNKPEEDHIEGCLWNNHQCQEYKGESPLEQEWKKYIKKAYTRFCPGQTLTVAAK